MRVGNVQQFHHVQFHVSNALQSAFWYCCNFGFNRFALRRSESTSEVAIRNGQVILLFKCALTPNQVEITDGIAIHGDYIRDVTFVVDDLDAVLRTVEVYDRSLILESRHRISDDYGSLFMAKIKGSTGSIVHTLLQNINYTGCFLPGFQPINSFQLCQSLTPVPHLNGIDHVVEGHPANQVNNVVEWYANTLRMTRFWSIDEHICQTEFSSLKAVFVGNAAKSAKVVLVEPVGGRGQVQDYIDCNGGPGVQHIAFQVDDILSVVGAMRKRGVEFLDIPDSYYDLLEMRLAESAVTPKEDLTKIRQLKLLLDFDENGYLLQIFTKPMQDRPTFFIEVIQRHNYEGFGAGNFKALFSAVEMERKKREENTIVNT